MENVGYYDGQIGLIEDIRVPMDDRGCYFGDGVYEATLGRNHHPFALDEHIDRLYNSAGLIRIKIPMEKPELKKLLLDLTAKIDTEDVFMIYWQVTRGEAPRKHDFPDTPAKIWVTVKPYKMADLSKEISLITKEDTRFLHCNIKTLNLLPNVMANQEAKENGCYEAVFHRGERVTECSHSNISILKNGIFKTAPTDNLILPGIARAHMIKMCKRLNIPVDETPFTLTELMDADEVIVSSSGFLCGFAAKINGKPVGGRAKELFCKIQEMILNEFYEETGGR